MHPFAMETAAILVHSLNRLSLCTKMAAVVVAKLLLCCDIIRKRSIELHDWEYGHIITDPSSTRSNLTPVTGSLTLPTLPLFWSGRERVGNGRLSNGSVLALPSASS